MLETLSKGFRAARERLTGVAELSEENIESALRDVRMALLEADVALPVVRQFLARVKEKALGQSVQLRAKADEYRAAELAKAKARLARGEDPARVLEGLAAGLVNKILHHPTQALNRAAEGERDALVRAVETLFPDNGGGREEPEEP